MSAGRRAAFARQALHRFDKHEAELRPAIETAIHKYLGVLRRRLQQHGTKLLAAARQPSPAEQAELARVFTQDEASALADLLAEGAEEWPGILDSTLIPAYRGLLGAIGNITSDHPAVANAVQAWRDQWLADRRQVLVGVPDMISSDLRTNLSQIAGADGTNVDDARERIQAMLDDGYPQWSGRAQTIARTETVGANNQGSLAAWQAMAQAAGAATATKTWLATNDERTRQSHADLDGTSVGIHEKFDLGDSTMNGPGDPDGDAGEVINCRCTMTYDIPDDSTGGGEMSDIEEGSDVGEEGDDALTAAAGGGYDGAVVMLGVAPDDATRIEHPAGDPAAGLHCTLLYLDQPADAYNPEQRAAFELAMITALGPLLPIPAEAWALAHFNPASTERDPATTMLVQSPELASVRMGATDALSALEGIDESTQFPLWTPHVTIGYGVDLATVPLETLGALTFDRVIMAWGDAESVIAGPQDKLTAATEDNVTTPAPPADPAVPVAQPGATPPAQSAPQLDQDLTPRGQTWSGCLALLDQPSSDGRVLKSGGMILRPLPQTVNWQKASAPGHDGNVVVGRVLSVTERDGMLWGTGDYLDPMMHFDAQEAMSIVDAGVGMVSVDSIPQMVSFADRDGNPIDPALYEGDANDVVAVFESYEFGGVTIMNFPAFADARIQNDPLDAEQADDLGGAIIMPTDGAFDGAAAESAVIADDGSSVTLSDGTVVAVGDTVSFPDQQGDPTGEPDTGTITAINVDAQTVTVAVNPDADGDTDPGSVDIPVTDLAPAADPVDDAAGTDSGMSLLAASISRPYVAKFFAKRQLDGPTPMTINEETGEVYGHAGKWGECHTGHLLEGVCKTLPKSKDGYRWFHTGGPVKLDDGTKIPVGKLTVGGGHYYGNGGMRGAIEHYDRTSSVFAVTRAYEDEWGVQLVGQLVHDLPQKTLEAAIISGQLSGDWREYDGNLELCAALCVNDGGFPMHRPQPKFGFSPDGEQVSLVAASIVYRQDVDGVRLPSGARVSRNDFDALVAASVAAISRKPAGGRDELAAARRRKAEAMRMRLELNA